MVKITKGNHIFEGMLRREAEAHIYVVWGSERELIGY
jgi:hypothetical protein